MKAFGTYISKYLLSFFVFALALLLVNILAFAFTFGGIVFREYGTAAPANMLEAVAADLPASGISEETEQELNGNQIWAMLLDADGKCDWTLSLPEEIPTQYTIQDVAVFSKGYLQDYPVFVRSMGDGLLVQSAKIKDLVQDLNLVSQLKYEMQPLHKEPVRLSKLLRSCAADLLNAGVGPEYSVEVEISSDAETVVMECDARLIARAMNNLVQNSINHNLQGCTIRLCLACSDTAISLAVADDGVGLSAGKLQELEEKPHYMESTDEQLNLRHGLGLLLVRQIVEAHGGTIKMERAPQNGYQTVLLFQR